MSKCECNEIKIKIFAQSAQQDCFSCTNITKILTKTYAKRKNVTKELRDTQISDMILL